jgi:uncharacterized protein with FMN-binding domain
MKKILLSVFLIAFFGVYVAEQRSSDDKEIATISAPPVNQSSSQSAPTANYKDGQYIGDTADAFYGNIQIKVTVSSGKISDVAFLQYPNDRETSVQINSQAMPLLKQEAIIAQSANVDIISGATQTSMAFIQSLRSALSKAQG